MGKSRQRQATRRQENNIGCMWGLIRMFYLRRDAKFLLDRKQGSRRHTFSGFPGRRHSRKKSRDFEEIDEDRDNMDECSTRKPTVKRLMEDELGKVKQLKKIPNDEVQRILADLGHDVCLDKSSMQNSKTKGAKNHNTSITMGSPPGSLDPSRSKCMKQAGEDDLELDLEDFLGQIYRYHDEWPHDDCKNNSEPCPKLKSLIHTKLNELNNPPCDLAYEQTPESEEKELLDDKHLCNSRADQSKKLTDALEMLSLDNELFLKTLQKPNSHILENIQKHQNRHVGTKLEHRDMHEKSDIVEDTKSSNQHELAIKTQSKESRHIFFWKKDKSNRRHASEGTNSSQPVNKIVILKPNPRRWIDPAVATTSTCVQQQSCTIQDPEYSATENSKFSIKEVRRRFKIVTGETRKGRPSVYGDDLQRDRRWLKDSAFTIKRDSIQVSEQTSAQKASGTANNNFRPSNSSKQKQRNDGLGGINSNIITSKDAFIFYEEAKKHLTEILQDKSQTAKYRTVQISKSLAGMLSLPQSSTSSPRNSPRVEDRIDLSPEERNICAIHKAEREESAKERSKPDKNSGSVACRTSETLDEQTVQERHFMKEEATHHGDELDIVCIEEIDKPDCSETICDACCTPAEQRRYNSSLEIMEGEEPGKEHVEMFPCTPENVVEKPEHQEPKTPISSASLELISQISPKGNHEKQEQPSPVSVLDPFFHEDADSPDRETMIKCELHQDILRGYSPDAGLDQGIFWEDKDVRLGYIKTVLELSELCTYQNLEVWYLDDELISPCLFEELHQGNQTDDIMLLFDCIREAIAVIQGTYFRNPPCLSFLKHNIQAPPMGQNLISEINKHIEGHLYHQFPSTLHQLVNMDLEDGTWMNLRSESEEIVVDMWEFILDELLEEVAYDLWI